MISQSENKNSELTDFRALFMSAVHVEMQQTRFFVMIVAARDHELTVNYYRHLSDRITCH